MLVRLAQMRRGPWPMTGPDGSRVHTPVRCRLLALLYPALLATIRQRSLCTAALCLKQIGLPRELVELILRHFFFFERLPSIVCACLHSCALA